MSTGSIVALSILGIIMGGLYIFQKGIEAASREHSKNSNNMKNKNSSGLCF